MKSAKTLVLGAALLASVSLTSFAALAKDITVGVSWSNFQEERWKTDEAAIKGALDKVGAKYISADAQASPSQATHRRREPDLQGRERPDHPGDGQRGDSAGGQEGDRRRHSRSSPMTA